MIMTNTDDEDDVVSACEGSGFPHGLKSCALLASDKHLCVGFAVSGYFLPVIAYGQWVQKVRVGSHSRIHTVWLERVRAYKEPDH